MINGTESARDAAATSAANFRGKSIAYIAQSAAASFNPAMTLMDQVCEAPVIHGVMTAPKPQPMRSPVPQLQLPDPETFGDRYPHEVSGGQLQRAMAAMAMAAAPDIIVLDEPTTALDVTTQIECLRAAARPDPRTRHRGLYITHDLAVVAQIADRIMVLRRGKMVEVGDAGQMLRAAERGLHQPPRQRARAAHAIVDPQPRRADAGDRAMSGRLSRQAEGHQRRQPHVRARRDGRGGRRIRLGQSTLARVVTGLLPRCDGDVKFKGDALPPRLAQRTARRAAPIADGPPDARRRAQPAADPARDDRPAGGVLFQPLAAASARARARTVAADGAAGGLHRPQDRASFRAARSSASRSRARSPPSPISSSATRSTSALDQLVGEEILRLLKRLQDELGVAYLFITHDLGTVRRIANKVAVMLKGKMVASGPTGEIFAPPYHPYTELLLSSVPEMRPEWLDEVLARRAAKEVRPN